MLLVVILPEQLDPHHGRKFVFKHAQSYIENRFSNFMTKHQVKKLNKNYFLKYSHYYIYYIFLIIVLFPRFKWLTYIF